jgi:hypothetical protein
MQQGVPAHVVLAGLDKSHHLLGSERARQPAGLAHPQRPGRGRPVSEIRSKTTFVQGREPRLLLGRDCGQLPGPVLLRQLQSAGAAEHAQVDQPGPGHPGCRLVGRQLRPNNNVLSVVAPHCVPKSNCINETANSDVGTGDTTSTSYDVLDRKVLVTDPSGNKTA